MPLVAGGIRCVAVQVGDGRTTSVTTIGGINGVSPRVTPGTRTPRRYRTARGGMPRAPHDPGTDAPSGRSALNEVATLSTATRNYGHDAVPAYMVGRARSAPSPEGTTTLPYLCIEGLSDGPRLRVETTPVPATEISIRDATRD